MARKKQEYNNESITALTGADGCVSARRLFLGRMDWTAASIRFLKSSPTPSTKRARGTGDRILVTRYLDHSLEVQDFAPAAFRWTITRANSVTTGNWCLRTLCRRQIQKQRRRRLRVFAGAQGLGSCATQYASEYFDVEVQRDGEHFTLHFEKGENIGGLHKENRRKTKRPVPASAGNRDLEVFTDIDIPVEFFRETLKRQAVVNRGLVLFFRNEVSKGKFETEEFCYPEGITDYVKEIARRTGDDRRAVWEGERTGRDRADRDDYRVKFAVACTFSNRVQQIEYYHNSSFLEHGGSPERRRQAGVRLAD